MKIIKRPFFGKAILAFSALVFMLLGLSQCKKDNYRGWTYYTDSPPPPRITELRSVISNCVPPYPVTFYQETQNALGNMHYRWDFGDGTTSADQNPHHIYATPGNYNVRLIVSNEVGADTAYLSMSQLNQSSIPVVADFSYQHFNNNNFAPNKIVLSNNSSGANQYYWYFGDGSQSSNVNPDHIYHSAGMYNITLRGTCTDGSFSETTRNVFVTPAPQRVFIDAINLMLPTFYKNKGVYIDIFHNTTLVATTVTKSPSSFPVKFIRPNDFMIGYFFDYVQFSSNEVFEFWIMRDNGSEPPIFINKIVLSAADIRNNFYPRTYFQLETVPPITDVFIDLYLSY